MAETSVKAEQLRNRFLFSFLNQQIQDPFCTSVRKICDLLVSAGAIEQEHVDDTPSRVFSSYGEYFSGVGVDPSVVLEKQFPTKSSEMVVVRDIEFVSLCAHHWSPILGVAHFGYIPNGAIVGLSKIPRLIEILARRPQVQEKLTTEVADIFSKTVKTSLGCGVVIDALHLCMLIRGVKKQRAWCRTTALRGMFLENASVKQEFLSAVNLAKPAAVGF